MREIGSEFWDVPVKEIENGLFPKSTQWFLSGRSALRAIIKELKGYKTVSMPSWCCDSMIKPFLDAGFKVNFYPVVYCDRLVQKIESDSDVIFLIDYFGYSNKQTNYNYSNKIVIRDVTQSILSSEFCDADFYFGSLRKWCGVWTGGYAWTKDGHRLEADIPTNADYITFRCKAMEMKRKYIVERQGNKEYLKNFTLAENCLETAGISMAARRDVDAAKSLDIDFIKRRRRINAEILRSAFFDYLIFPELKLTDTPMFVPIFVPDGKRDALYRYLINNEIYCPIHWPISKYHELDGKTEYMYLNELSLVCDQRYTEKDMNRMVDTIKQFLGG